MLSVRRLNTFYGHFQALFDVSLEVPAGETVAIIGANSAGKTTLLSTIAGLLNSPKKSIEFEDRIVSGLPAHEIVRLGVAMVPEGRQMFPSLTVEENLRVGAHAKRRGPWSLQRVYRLFPALQERRHFPATQLSGGEQQMAAIGRALMANPKLLLCDEISLGLAPVAIRNIYAACPQIRAEGTSVLLVEQDIRQALAVSSYVYCLQEGRVSLAGRPDELSFENISEAYFGR